MSDEYKEEDLPLSIVNRGQFTVSVTSQERRRIIRKLLKKAETKKAGEAAWKAILAYVGEEEA